MPAQHGRPVGVCGFSRQIRRHGRWWKTRLLRLAG
jgi:hypothetical protein